MYLVRVGEIFLKGLNRGLFLRKLYQNLENKGVKKIIKFSNKFLIDNNEQALKTTFGIANYSKVIECDLNKIKDKALKLTRENKTFCVRVKRTDKVLKTSQDLEKEIGAYIVEKTNLKVNLTKPEQTIYIDLIKDKAYLFTEKIGGLNGLPTGCEGEVYLEVKDEMKSTVAGYLMMKRGCNLTTSKDLPLLNIFNKIKIGKPKDIIITDDTEIKLRKGLILSPLIGYKIEEIKKIYDKIILLNKH